MNSLAHASIGIALLAAGTFCLGAEPPVLRDKTLVVWVLPANLTQHGGSALTIEDKRSRFDGIVFGELAAGKWMAGSDHYLRTTKDQAKLTTETADAKTFVQIAIVYKEKQISVYRNGSLYSQHTMPNPPMEFGAQTMVGIGKRHRMQGGAEHFAGAIDDARIYAQALSLEQLQALKTNEKSEIAPWAWWNFENNEAKDLMDRFEPAELSGGAKIVDGKLMLDGISGEFLAKTPMAPFVPETPARPAVVPADWLTFHLAHPGPGVAIPGDPNCAFFWKGRCHLHYIYKNDDGFVFAHVSSEDMVHWKWHPTTLTPEFTGHGMFSGTGFLTKEGRPAIIYHGQGSGRNQIAIAEDDQLEKWSKPWKLEPKVRPDQDGSKIANWDPDAWIDGDNYYALSGGSPGSGKPPTLFKSVDLKSWDYLGLFLTHDMSDVQKSEDISCPNFFKLGNQHMLLCISHTLGCRYYLGEWKNERFAPSFHARMNWKAWEFFAPESVLTPDGRRVMWAWCRLEAPQSGIQSLPRELSLPDDGVLRIKPLRELERLRFDEKNDKLSAVKGDVPAVLKDISGDALELKIVVEPGAAKAFGVAVYCDSEGRNGFSIAIDVEKKFLQLGSVNVPFTLEPGERAELRIFLDKNMIEVFANDRQAAVAATNTQGFKLTPEKMHVSIFSRDGELAVPEIKAWKLKSIYAK